MAVKNKYELWSCTIDDIKFLESSKDTLQEIFKDYKEKTNKNNTVCVITDPTGNIIIDGRNYVYENDGQHIYKRRFCTDLRERVI